MDFEYEDTDDYGEDDDDAELPQQQPQQEQHQETEDVRISIVEILKVKKETVKRTFECLQQEIITKDKSDDWPWTPPSKNAIFVLNELCQKNNVSITTVDFFE